MAQKETIMTDRSLDPSGAEEMKRMIAGGGGQRLDGVAEARRGLRDRSFAWRSGRGVGGMIGPITIVFVRALGRSIGIQLGKMLKAKRLQLRKEQGK